jgi:hypothetical protein
MDDGSSGSTQNGHKASTRRSRNRAGRGFEDLQDYRLRRRSTTAEEEPSPTTESDPYGTAATSPCNARRIAHSRASRCTVPSMILVKRPSCHWVPERPIAAQAIYLVVAASAEVPGHQAPSDLLDPHGLAIKSPTPRQPLAQTPRPYIGLVLFDVVRTRSAGRLSVNHPPPAGKSAKVGQRLYYSSPGTRKGYRLPLRQTGRPDHPRTRRHGDRQTRRRGRLCHLQPAVRASPASENSHLAAPALGY